MNDKHFQKVCVLLDTFDQGCDYVNEYNAMLHDYNGIILYQAESQFLKKIGDNPGITITELATYFNKTTSACSQLMYRMKRKICWSSVETSTTTGNIIFISLPTEKNCTNFTRYLKHNAISVQLGCFLLLLRKSWIRTFAFRRK